MANTVLITGASSGIGKATAILLAKNGYNVYGGARGIEKMEELKAIGVIPVKLDATDDESMVSCVKYILSEQGRIDILINNAGSANCGALEDMPLADARKLLEVNLFGPARLIQLVLPDMRKNKFGKIVNISSVNGKFTFPMSSWYSASKFGIEGLSDSLRNEVKQFGIDVVIIEPAGTRTEIAEISREYLMRISGDTVYKPLATSVAQSIYDPETVQKYPEPNVIADLVKKAIEARHPQTRYVSGSMTKLVLFLRRILSDKLFDKLILSQIK